MKTKYLILTLACLGLASCEEFLDVKPKGEVIPETIENFEALLNGTIQGSSCHMQDYMSDDALLPFGYPPGPAPFNLYDAAGPQSQGNPMRKLYQFNPEPFTAVDNDIMWKEGHARLQYFNTVINNVMNSTGGTEAKKRSLRAEALVQRAIEYYSMVNIYAQTYDPATAATELGIPMFMQPDNLTESPVRSTVQEVYDRILSDVNEALPDLPQTPVVGKFRASYSGAVAFLARVYLTMGDYDKALQYADEALTYNDVLANLNDQIANLMLQQGPPDVIPFYTPNNTPVGWVTNADGTPVPDANTHPETILARTFQSPYGLGSGANVLMSVELGDLFDKAHDKRYELWYANWPPMPYANLEGEFGVKAYLRGDQFNVGPGTGEMYLIRAECNARAGQLQKALDDVNHLRENRIATDSYVEKKLADFNNDDFKVLKFVLEERRRELAFRGFRVTDLKRLNKDPRFAKTITHETPEGTFTLEPNSYKYLRQLFPGSTIYHPDWQLNPVD